MARIFTIEFNYQGSTHSALVSERTHPLATEYSLTMLDELIEEALPAYKILSSPSGSIAFLGAGKPDRLMTAILNAISQHVGLAV